VGSNLYTGSAQQSLMDNFHNTQETLDTLAADTGGKALLDSNDLTLGMTQVQKDMSSYYMLSYASTNAAEDGKYRRIQVKLAPKLADLKAKLEFKQGYYAPTTFAKMTGANKEAQLQEALQSDNPVTDLADRRGGGLLPPGERQILRADLGAHPRLGIVVHQQRRQGGHRAGFHRRDTDATGRLR
jgi:hypothetical protein